MTNGAAHAERSPTWPRVLGAATGAYAFVGGALTLVGWYTGSPRLVSWDNSGITMKANTALCALIAGASLLILALRGRRHGIATVLGTMVATIGALTLFEHITGINLGIDSLLVREAPGALATSAPGRMGLPGSTPFLLIGLSVNLLMRERGRYGPPLASILGLFAIGIASLSLVGYWYGASVMYSLPRVTGIAFQTATMVFMLGVGIVVSVPDSEPMRLLRAQTAAGKLARTTLPFIIGLPAVLGWLRVNGQRIGLYDTAFGTALFALAIIALLTILFWRSLSSADRHKNCTELRPGPARVRRNSSCAHVTDSAAVIVAHCSRDLRYIFAIGRVPTSSDCGSIRSSVTASSM